MKVLSYIVPFNGTFKRGGCDMSKSSDANRLDSVSNALKILKSFSTLQPVRRVGELATELNVSKSTASRLVQTLVAEGFLIKDHESVGYRLGVSTLTLGGIFANSNELYREIFPVLNDIVQQTKESAHLGVIIDYEVVYLLKNIGPYYSNVKTQVGKHNPIHATSSGKLLLALGNESLYEELLKRGLETYTEDTIVNPLMLKKELDKIKQQGYATSISEYDEDNYSIAAPVYNMDNEVVAAIGFAGPMTRFNQSQLEDQIRVVVRAGREASERLGWDA